VEKKTVIRNKGENALQEGKDIRIVILSAGKGTRMKSDLAKVLHEVAGRPMLEYVLDTAEKVGAAERLVVVGHQAERVEAVVGGRGKCVLQAPQQGTGHAVMCARPFFQGSAGDLLVLYGDMPLISEKTVRAVLAAHGGGGNSATVLTAALEDPAGYGRIIRGPDGRFERIVEHKDATEAERLVKEVNTGIYCFRIPDLLEALDELTNDNAQGEYYLTDTVELLNRRGRKVGAVVLEDPLEAEGINTVEQLARAEELLLARVKGRKAGRG